MRSIYRTIKCILLLYDEITGRIAVQNLFRVYNSKGTPAIYKGNGIYLFLLDSEKEDIITVEAEGYQTQKFFLCKDERETVYRLWMMPSKNNERASRMVSLSGRALQGQQITVYFDYSSQCRLLRGLNPYDGSVCLCHSLHNTVEGQKLRIQNTENGCYENLVLGEMCAELESSHEYQLSVPLKYEYPVRHTMIYRSISLSADETGEFFAVFRGFESVPESQRICKIEMGQDRCYETVILQQMR